MKRWCFWNPSDELFRHLCSSQEFLDRKHDWVVCFLYTVFLKVVITLPNVSDCEDKERKNTIDGQLVPVVWPLHVDLILAQPGHCVGWPSLCCEALKLNNWTRLTLPIFDRIPQTPSVLLCWQKYSGRWWTEQAEPSWRNRQKDAGKLWEEGRVVW